MLLHFNLKQLWKLRNQIASTWFHFDCWQASFENSNGDPAEKRSFGNLILSATQQLVIWYISAFAGTNVLKCWSLSPDARSHLCCLHNTLLLFYWCYEKWIFWCPFDCSCYVYRNSIYLPLTSPPSLTRAPNQIAILAFPRNFLSKRLTPTFYTSFAPLITMHCKSRSIHCKYAKRTCRDVIFIKDKCICHCCANMFKHCP